MKKQTKVILLGAAASLAVGLVLQSYKESRERFTFSRELQRGTWF